MTPVSPARTPAFIALAKKHISAKRTKAKAGVIAARQLLDWPISRLLHHWLLRRSDLPDIPEVRRLLRATFQKGFTFGAAPSQQKMRALREEAVEAIWQALPDEPDWKSK